MSDNMKLYKTPCLERTVDLLLPELSWYSSRMTIWNMSHAPSVVRKGKVVYDKRAKSGTTKEQIERRSRDPWIRIYKGKTFPPNLGGTVR